MSWLPGVGPVKDVSAVGVSRGLSEDWFSDTSSKKEIKKGDFWDIIDNPLFEVAAEAKGYDWAEWVKDAKGKVGTGPDSGGVMVKATIVQETWQQQMGGAPIRTTETQYEWMTKAEAEEQGLEYEKSVPKRWRNKKTGEIIIGAPNKNNSDRMTRLLYDKEFGDGSESFGAPFPGGGMARFVMGRVKDDWGDLWEEARDWGVGDGDIQEDLDEISGWLKDIINVNDHLHPIIREGPKGEHYGIEGDIWEHYGLDQEIEPPKELDWDSAEKDMVLSKAVKSSVTYSTPGDLIPVNLH